MSLDRIDRKILELLQKDGRLSNVKLASKVGLSPTPCLDRVRRLEREGYILGYVALADARKLNASTIAFIQVLLTNTSTANLREFSSEMMSLPEVESCHMVAGGFDFLLKSMVFLTLGLRFGFKRLVFLLKMLIVKLELVNFILHTVVRFMMVGKTNDRLRHAEE